MRARVWAFPPGQPLFLQSNVMRVQHKVLGPDVLLMIDPAKRRLWTLVATLSFVLAAAIWWQHAHP